MGNHRTALNHGYRALPGGSSLFKLLAKHRGVTSPSVRPPLTIKMILTWADAHHQRTGKWPNVNSGGIDGAQGETWSCIDAILRRGQRGVPGGTSLTQLLAERRGARNRQALPPFTIKQILVWADEHHKRTGQWPSLVSGIIAG